MEKPCVEYRFPIALPTNVVLPEGKVLADFIKEGTTIGYGRPERPVGQAYGRCLHQDLSRVCGVITKVNEDHVLVKPIETTMGNSLKRLMEKPPRGAFTIRALPACMSEHKSRTESELNRVLSVCLDII